MKETLSHKEAVPMESSARSNERNPGCLGYLGDEILPSYMGISS